VGSESEVRIREDLKGYIQRENEEKRVEKEGDGRERGCGGRE